MQILIGCTFIAFAIVLSIVDWKQMILPTSIIRWGMGVGIVEYMLQAKIQGNWLLLGDILTGAIIGYLFFMAIFYSSYWILKKEGMGYGDVRLMGFIGLYIGIDTLFIAILIASILASIYGVIRFIYYKKSTAYPFGPFLNIGGCITFVWGEYFLNNIMNILRI